MTQDLGLGAGGGGASGVESNNGHKDPSVAPGALPTSTGFQMLDQWHSQPRNIRIIHIGAGATGICAAYKMERQLDNYELVCYEKNKEIGGTWLESKASHWNLLRCP